MQNPVLLSLYRKSFIYFLLSHVLKVFDAFFCNWSNFNLSNFQIYKNFIVLKILSTSDLGFFCWYPLHTTLFTPRFCQVNSCWGSDSWRRECQTMNWAICTYIQVDYTSNTSLSGTLATSKKILGRINEKLMGKL